MKFQQFTSMNICSIVMFTLAKAVFIPAQMH